MKFLVITAASLGLLSQGGIAQLPNDTGKVPATTATAKLPATPAEWSAFLGKIKGRIPQCSVEWKVLRDLPGNPEMAAHMGKDYDKRIAEARNPRDREMQIKNKASIMDSVANPKIIPLTIRLDYFSPKRFYIYQSFDYPDRSVVYECFADGDGLIYIENHNNRNVRLLPETATILDELARGLPEFVLSKTLGDAAEVKVAEETPDLIVLDAVSGLRGNAMRLWVDKATLQFTKWQEGSLPSRSALGVIQQEVQTERIRLESGYPIADEIVFKRFYGKDKPHMQETWTLVDFKVRTDPDQMHSTKYLFKPGFSGTDETGPKPRRFDPQAEPPKPK